MVDQHIAKQLCRVEPRLVTVLSRMKDELIEWIDVRGRTQAMSVRCLGQEPNREHVNTWKYLWMEEEIAHNNLTNKIRQLDEDAHA